MLSFSIADFLNAFDLATISRTSLAFVLLSHSKKRASVSFFKVPMHDSKFNFCVFTSAISSHSTFILLFCQMTSSLHAFLQEQRHPLHGHLYNLIYASAIDVIVNNSMASQRCFFKVFKKHVFVYT